MDEGGIGFIVCVDKKGCVVAVVSDGDFRRAILRGVDLGSKVSEFANRDFTFLPVGYKNEEAGGIFSSRIIRHIPILRNGKLVDILLEEDFLKAGRKGTPTKKQIHLPVVIMAGGKGSRLDPFTRILPKSLIPIGDKPIIELIMEKFAEYGMKEFYVSVNHKARMIKVYLEELQQDYNVTYLEEETPLGTAGSLKLLERGIKSAFFVNNCDVIIEADYSRIYEFHKEGGYILTLVGSLQHHKIPYGVCELDGEGVLETITEKPEYDFLVNTGMYLMEPSALEVIPRDQQFDLTDLLKQLKNSGRKVGVYPVSEKSWMDIGRMEEYKKSLTKFLGA